MINQAGRETRLVDDLGCRASSQVTVSQGAQREGKRGYPMMKRIKIQCMMM